MKDLSRSLRDIIEGAARPVSAQEAMVRSGPGAIGRGDARQSSGAKVESLWLDDDGPARKRRVASGQRVAVTVAVVACLVAIAVPVIVLANAGPRHPAGRGDAKHAVLAALSATTDSGSFDFSYDLSSTPATTTPPTTTTTICREIQTVYGAGGGLVAPVEGSTGTSTTVPTFQSGTERVCQGPALPVETNVTGSGVIDTNPMAMVATASIGSGGGLDVVVRVNSQTVYEDASSGATASAGLAPSPADASASGQELSGFAGLVESTLGIRNGAVAMMGMASPTGFLDLYQQDFSGATQIGTATVAGVQVTEYQVTQDLSRVASAPGISPEEAKTIDAALAVLEQQGYTTDTVNVSIDGAGYIRQVKSTLSFKDGATTTLATTFSDFGCAGTVLMPGQQGSATPPADCTSPDSTVATPASQQSPSSSVPTTTPISQPLTTDATVPPTTGTTAPMGASSSGGGLSSSTTTTSGSADSGASTSTPTTVSSSSG